MWSLESKFKKILGNPVFTQICSFSALRFFVFLALTSNFWPYGFLFFRPSVRARYFQKLASILYLKAILCWTFRWRDRTEITFGQNLMLKVKKDPQLDAEVERKTQKLMFKVKERPKTWFWKWKKDPKFDAESEKKTQNLMLKLKERPKTWCC